MFGLERDEVVVLEDPLLLEQDKLLEELLEDCAAVEDHNQLINDKALKKRKKSVQNEPRGSNDQFKKITHREIERQRRQEMAALYSSLRSLLPPEYIKGRRSISDHMDKTVNYIKHMQKKIHQMQARRDELKNALRTSANGGVAEIPVLSTDDDDSVKINSCRDGIEILITNSSDEKGFAISKVLRDLVERGFNVISYISTRSLDGSFLHNIYIQVNDHAKCNMAQLQERLVNVIKSG